MRACIGLVMAMLALAACRTTEHPAGSIPSTSIWPPAPLQVAGDYVHPSGISFPAKAADFARVESSRFDREGNDVGIGYRRIWKDDAAEFRAELTVFVYPSALRDDGVPVPLDEQFEKEVRGVLKNKAYADTKEVRRADADARLGERPVHVRAAEFTLTGVGPKFDGQPMIVTLAAFLSGPWHVTYELTIPPARRDVCLGAVEQLLAEMKLPPMGLPASAPADGR